MAASLDAVSDLAHRALDEDAPAGDVTSELVVAPGTTCTAKLIAKAAGVLAGTRVVEATFAAASERAGEGDIAVSWELRDGDRVQPGGVVAFVRGPARAILRAERPAVNLLAHLSGVATLTRAFVDAADPARILCTRKTTPGMRELEREAVAAGGGALHRASLSDAVLVKDNHMLLTGGVREAVLRAKAGSDPVEAEVETIEEAAEAVDAGADRILLDNPGPDLVREVVALVGDPERLEVSGGITLSSAPGLVAAGARILSVGRITHSAPALDLSLEVIDAG